MGKSNKRLNGKRGSNKIEDGKSKAEDSKRRKSNSRVMGTEFEVPMVTGCEGQWSSKQTREKIEDPTYGSLASTSGARCNLAEELDAINAVFDKRDEGRISEDEIVTPDGIRIMVNRTEDKEFQEEDLDYDEETIYPIENLNESGEEETDDADTVVGEDPLNVSMNSSNIISFKMRSVNRSSLLPDERTANVSVLKNFSEKKSVSKMTPEELIEANPAL